MQNLTELETELLAIVRLMAAKLIEAAEYIEHIKPPIGGSEMSAACRSNSDYCCYVERFKDQVITYKGRAYTATDIKEMRDWVADCQWADIDADNIDELTDLQVLKGVDRNNAGGLEQFDCTSYPLAVLI